LADNYVNKDSIVIDATCGNGNDTLYYANKCKFIYGFDIQQKAIENTRKLLEDNNISNYKLILDSHSKMESYIEEKADLILFNLGYLPSADKNITTLAESTIIALNSSLNLLNVDGLICIVIYYGHQAGKIERQKVLEFASQLDRSIYHTGFYTSPNQLNCPPEILLITKKK